MRVMRKMILGAGLCGALLAAAPVRAAEEGSLSVGLGADFAHEDFQNTSGLSFDDSRSWTAQVGYRVNDLLAIGLELEQLDDFDMRDLDFGDGLSLGGSIDGSLLTLNARLYPFERSFGLRPYLVAGAGYMAVRSEATASISAFGQTFSQSVSERDHAAVLQAGVGVDVQLDDHWFVELEGSYKRPTSELRDLRFYSLGGAIQYRF